MLNSLSPPNDKETVQKLLNEMRKHIRYLEETNWMFVNNNDNSPFDNLPNQI